MSEKDKENTALVWLGAAASVIGVLAFLGISNWTELGELLVPKPSASAPSSPSKQAPRETSGSLAACRLVAQATAADLPASPDTSQSSQNQRTLARQLRNAADTTDDVVFKTNIRNAAEDMELYADAHDSAVRNIDEGRRRLAVGDRAGAQAAVDAAEADLDAARGAAAAYQKDIKIVNEYCRANR